MPAGIPSSVQNPSVLRQESGPQPQLHAVFFRYLSGQAPGNHQYHNAMALVKKNAAVMIEEKDLTGANLIKMVKELTSDRKKLIEIGNNAKNMAILDSRERIYAIIMKVLNK